MAEKQIKIHIRGRVQGVGYRWSTKKKALSLKLRGMVKNKADGSVYIEAVGNEKALNEFIQWCQQGPSHARVESVQTETTTIKNYKTFDIGF